MKLPSKTEYTNKFFVCLFVSVFSFRANNIFNIYLINLIEKWFPRWIKKSVAWWCRKHVLKSVICCWKWMSLMRVSDFWIVCFEFAYENEAQILCIAPEHCMFSWAPNASLCCSCCSCITNLFSLWNLSVLIICECEFMAFSTCFVQISTWKYRFYYIFFSFLVFFFISCFSF